MSTEDRLHRMMSTVGTCDVDTRSWSDFAAVAHRDRSRHQIITTAGALAAVVLVSLGTAAVLNLDRAEVDVPPSDRNVVPVPLPEDVPSDCPTAPEFTEGPLGTVAYLGATELHVVDVATGEDSILVQGGEGFGEGVFSDQVLISPDGQWVSFGGGLMVPTAGGEVCAPLGEDVQDLQWAPDETVVALRDGSLVVGGWQKEAIVGSYDGYRLETVSLSPNGGYVAVSAAATDPAQDEDEGIWLIQPDLELPGSGRSSDVAIKYTNLAQGIEVAGWEPTGQWVLFWNNYGNASASLNADGTPLRAVEVVSGAVATVTDNMISERDQMTWCGDQLLFADGSGRLMQDKKVIASAQAPSWAKDVELRHDQLSLTDPACDDSGSVFTAIATPLSGNGVPSLARWSEGDGRNFPSLPAGLEGALHAQLSRDGRVSVVEALTDNTGIANELIKIEGEDTATLGILGSQSDWPMVGGSRSWDWHRP